MNEGIPVLVPFLFPDSMISINPIQISYAVQLGNNFYCFFTLIITEMWPLWPFVNSLSF